LKSYRSPRDLLAEIEQVLAQKPSRSSPLEKVVEILYSGRHYLWVGIYLRVGERMERQAFLGPAPACRSFALGVSNVGIAGQSGIEKVVPDVSADPTYSMCFRETKSEMVAPIKIAGKTLGVIDVESDRLNAFGPKERILLKESGRRLAKFLSLKGKYILLKARRTTAEAAAPAKAPEAIKQQPSERVQQLRAAAGDKSRQ